TGSDGRTNFSAIKIDIPPGQVIALDDIVQSAMQSIGTGQLARVGSSDVMAISRTYTRSAYGSCGQFIPSSSSADAVGRGYAAISVPGLENDTESRSHLD